MVGVDQVAHVEVAVADVADQEEGQAGLLASVTLSEQRVGEAARWARRCRW